MLRHKYSDSFLIFQISPQHIQVIVFVKTKLGQIREEKTKILSLDYGWG